MLINYRYVIIIVFGRGGGDGSAAAATTAAEVAIPAAAAAVIPTYYAVDLRCLRCVYFLSHVTFCKRFKLPSRIEATSESDCSWWYDQLCSTKI